MERVDRIPQRPNTEEKRTPILDLSFTTDTGGARRRRTTTNSELNGKVPAMKKHGDGEDWGCGFHAMKKDKFMLK